MLTRWSLKGGGSIKVASNDRDLLSLRTLVVLGQYEKPLLNLLRGMVGLGDVVIDVGANEGYISIPLALKVGEQGRVYSIEPHPANVATLKENIGLNNLINVTVIPKAVSDEKGIMTFYGDRAWGTLINSHMTGESKTEVDLLDNIIQVPVKLIKIDVEGNEIRVIRGAKNLIQTFKPIIVFEVNLSYLAYVDISINETFDFLKGNGYQIFKERNGELESFDWFDQRVNTLFAIPEVNP